MSLRGHQADLVCLEERLSWAGKMQMPVERNRSSEGASPLPYWRCPLWNKVNCAPVDKWTLTQLGWHNAGPFLLAPSGSKEATQTVSTPPVAPGEPLSLSCPNSPPPWCHTPRWGWLMELLTGTRQDSWEGSMGKEGKFHIPDEEMALPPRVPEASMTSAA